MNRQDTDCKCRRLTTGQIEMALNYLMSRYAVSQEHAVARAVLHHLEILFERADDELDKTRRQHYVQIYNMWYTNLGMNPVEPAGGERVYHP